MRVLILVLLLIACAQGFAFAQAGGIGIFSDAGAYLDCTIVDAAPCLHPVYVVHKLCPGATASRFMVVSSGGFNMTYTGEIHNMPVSFGNSQTGVCLSYGACLHSDILLITINYFGQGLSGVCSFLEVVADPTSPSGNIEMMDCSGNVLAASSWKLYVNSDGSCGCWIDPFVDRVADAKPLKKATVDVPGDFCYPLPTQNGSWGQVKALYN